MYQKPLIGGMILSAMLTLSACAVDTTPQTAASPLDDATLNDNVTYAVQGVSGVSPNDLSVSTRDGVVSLTGRTQTRTQAQDAIEAARHVPGVQKVDYDISVDEP